MKTFRILRNIGITLFSILICLNFTSCSNDNDSGIVAKGKKLTKIVSGDWYIATLNYDNKGRLIEVSETHYIRDGRSETETYYYAWEDSIISIIKPNSVDNDTLYIKNGLVEKIDNYETLFYNGSKKLISYKKVRSDLSNTLSCFWEKDKLSSYDRRYRSDIDTQSKTVTFDYDGISCPKGCFHPIFLTLSDIDDSGWVEATQEEMFVFAHPELFGIKTTLLPATSNDGYYYQYEFDRNGYVSKIIVIHEEFGYDKTYTLTWE